MKIKVSEYFFSIQGEGMSAGVPCLFIRFPGCNLMCGGHGGKLVEEGKATWWCDSELLWKQGKEVGTTEIIESLNGSQKEALRQGIAHVVFTGGEPCLPDNTKSAITFLGDHFFDRKGAKIEVETNGTLNSYLLARADQINCSPKLSNSGMPREMRIKPGLLREINRRGDRTIVQFKFVVSTPQDIFEAVDLVEELDLGLEKVVLMPAADSQKELAEKTRLVWEVATKMGVRMCSRLHVLCYGKKVGV
jgi:organic radical activating enzyme